MISGFDKGPTWIVPTEIVRALAAPEGTKTMVHLTLVQAQFAAHAEVRLIDGRFIAVVGFEEPKLPGMRQEIGVLLQGVPKENAL